jgi:hypothetical protein
MAELGIGVGIEQSEMDLPFRMRTMSGYDLAYWASTFVAPGFPTDYDTDGQETDAASLISWAANRIGVTFPDTFAAAVVALDGNEVEIDQALKTRGAVLVSGTKIALCLGLDDIIDIIDGRFFVVQMTDTKKAKWTTGALISEVIY